MIERPAHTITETMVSLAIVSVLAGIAVSTLLKTRHTGWWWIKSSARPRTLWSPPQVEDGYFVHPDRPVYDGHVIRRDEQGNPVTYGDLFPDMVRPNQNP